jgi:hypothetical protein
MTTRRRCSECRCPFTPSPRALSTQRVCGAECRAARDRKLARARRRREIEGYRADERIRQKASRKRRAEAPAVAPDGACHGPPSPRNPAELPEEVVRFVDRALGASRATLLRDLSRIWLRRRENVATVGTVSRASFGAERPDPTAQSEAQSGRRHA